jgi:hypothetical protein
MWRRVVYGSHPRSVLLATPEDVTLLDFRVLETFFS